MEKQHSKLFYLVFGGFWLFAMITGAIAAAIVGDRYSYDEFRNLWTRMKRECSVPTVAKPST